MKAIMLSIQPQWVGNILNGDKTIEIRKTMPKCKLPCKVYVYCTKQKPYLINYGDEPSYRLLSGYSFKDANEIWELLNGKVVAEFTMEEEPTQFQMWNFETAWANCKDGLTGKWVGGKKILEESKLTIEELKKYAPYGNLFTWYIEDLKIYDEPKKLEEFKLNRAPQSWFYLEEVEDVKN